VFRPVPLLPAHQHVGQIVLVVLGLAEFRLGRRPLLVLRQERLALVVEREPVRLHAIEPDEIGSADAGLGEDEDGGRNAGVGAEDARGQRNDGLKLVVLDQNLPQRLVRGRRAEQHSFGHDHRSAPADLQEPQEQREKQEFGLLGLDDLLQVLRGRLVIERAGERRIGEEKAVAVLLARNVLGEGIARLNHRIFDAVQNHVHRADAQHGRIEIEAVKRALVEMPPQFRIAQYFGMLFAQEFARRDEKAAGAAGRIADRIAGRRLGQLDHQLDDVARGAELAVLPGGRDLASMYS